MRAIVILVLFAACAVRADNTIAFFQTDEWHRFECLSMLETGDTDSAIGPQGERGRYQISPMVWREHTKLPMSAASNPFTSLAVARLVMRERESAFEIKHGHFPNDAQWVMLWHKPRYVGSWNKLSAKEKLKLADYVRRFLYLRARQNHVKP